MPPIYLDTRGNSVLSIGICDRCNRKVPYTELYPDPNFVGMRVCKEDLDQFDPWRLPARQTENIALRFPRPDVSIALEPNQILTQGDPNQVGNSVFIEGVAPAANSQGDLNKNSMGIPSPQTLNPSIYTVLPATGSKVGGEVVIITGINFTNVTAVKFGGALASFMIDTSTQITAVVPAYPISGIVDVSVVSTFGTGTSHGAFTYT